MLFRPALPVKLDGLTLATPNVGSWYLSYDSYIDGQQVNNARENIVVVIWIDCSIEVYV